MPWLLFDETSDMSSNTPNELALFPRRRRGQCLPWLAPLVVKDAYRTSNVPGNVDKSGYVLGFKRKIEVLLASQKTHHY